jgi:cytochrome c553
LIHLNARPAFQRLDGGGFRKAPDCRQRQALTQSNLSFSRSMPMIKALRSRLSLTMMLAALAAPLAAQAQDAKAGQAKAAMCEGCHGIPGYQASFPEIHRVPMISGQNAKYLAAALDAYRKGDRKHPSMRAVAGSLSDADIADLAAYYADHGKAPAAVPAELSKPLPEALKDRLQTCVACHGANFNNTTDAANPRLAGQHADYLAAALRSYMVDGNPNVGRANATMRGMVAQQVDGKPKPTFSPAEIKQLSAYLASLPGELRTVKQPNFR